MKFGSITSRRCRRCGVVGTSQLPDTPLHREKNSHRLCVGCTNWQSNNPKKGIRNK
jgi:hypothetical protein